MIARTNINANETPVPPTRCILKSGNLSFKINRLFNDYNLTTVFRNTSKLDKYIKLGKAPLEKLENSNVIYKIPCLYCSKTYVGQTGRMLFVRCEEHKQNIKLNEKYHNVVTKHRNRKTWARIPAQSKASFFPQKDFQIL